MHTTTRHSNPAENLNARVLSDAASLLASAIRAEREGRTPEAYTNAEAAAARLGSYLTRTALELHIKPLPCIHTP